jgi:hypothetical protein
MSNGPYKRLMQSKLPPKPNRVKFGQVVIVTPAFSIDGSYALDAEGRGRTGLRRCSSVHNP